MQKIYAHMAAQAFYSEEVHGPLTIFINDPNWKPDTILVPMVAWVPPMIQVPDPEWVRPYLPDDPDQVDELAVHPMIEIADPEAVRPLVEVEDPNPLVPQIEVANPDCKVPADAVEISQAHYAELLASRSAGKVLDWSGELPVAIDRPAPDLDTLKASAVKVMDQACGEAITAGFSSKALGSFHGYGSTVTDQLNLTMLLRRGGGSDLVCADMVPNWTPRPHSEEQIEQVVDDLLAHIDEQRSKNWRLKALINKADTAEAVAAVRWARE